VARTDSELWIVRHGETEWSKSGQHTSVTDLDLTEEGADVARGLAQRFSRRLEGGEFDLVLSSPRLRARRTAELAGFDEVETTEDLAEWDYGDYEGLTTPQIRETVPDWTVWTHPCPGGETAVQVGERADAVLAAARSSLPDGDVVLVGHGHFSRVLMATWIELPATAGVRFAMDPASWAVLGDERGVAKLDQVNLHTPQRDQP
jgi:broad specificity phosphatase PhoE